MTESWWVARTMPQREHFVRQQLMRHGFTTYAPRIRFQGRVAFLFPTYLFIASVGRWSTVRWMNGVAQLIMSGEQPARLEHNVIAELHSRERDGFVKLPTHRSGLRKGQKIRIIRGSLCDQIGLYDGTSSRDRIRILLELLGRKVSVELAQSDVAPLEITRP